MLNSLQPAKRGVRSPGSSSESPRRVSWWRLEWQSSSVTKTLLKLFIHGDVVSIDPLRLENAWLCFASPVAC